MIVKEKYQLWIKRVNPLTRVGDWRLYSFSNTPEEAHNEFLHDLLDEVGTYTYFVCKVFVYEQDES